MESEETQDYVREAKSAEQEEVEERIFVPSAISVPQKPLFRYDNQCSEKTLSFWQLASVVIYEGEESYTTNFVVICQKRSRFTCCCRAGGVRRLILECQTLPLLAVADLPLSWFSAIGSLHVQNHVCKGTFFLSEVSTCPVLAAESLRLVHLCALRAPVPLLGPTGGPHCCPFLVRFVC